MKSRATFLLVLFYNLFSFSQNGLNIQNDSIENQIIRWNFSKSLNSNKILLFEKKHSKSSTDQIYAVTRTFLGIHYLDQKDTLQLNNLLDSLSSQIKVTNSANLKSSYYYIKGRDFFKRNLLDSAYANYNKSKQFIVKTKNNGLMFVLLEDMFDFFLAIQDFNGANSFGAEILAYAEQEKSEYFKALVYNILAVNHGLEYPEKSKKYFNQLFETLKIVKHQALRVDVTCKYYLNNSFIDIYWEKYKESEKNIKKADSVFNKNKGIINRRLEISIKQNLAIAEAINKNYKEAESLFKLAYDLCGEKNIQNKVVICYDFAYFYYYFKQDKIAAKKYLFEGLALLKKVEDADTKFLIYELLAEMANPIEANNYYKKAISAKTQAHAKKIKNKDAYSLVKYEVKAKEEENKLLKKQNELSKSELLSEKRRSRILQLLGVIGLLLIASLIAITNIRKKNLEFKANLAKAEARENERKKIALNLHDKVAGDLRAVYQKALKYDVDEITQPLFTIKNEIRNLSHKLSSVDFDEVSFEDQMINLASDYFEPKFRIKIQHINSIDLTLVNKEIKRTLFLVSREAIQNSKKHGEATLVSINFKSYKKTVQLEIKDNGKGFDLSSPRYCVGLKNQKERVNELQGTYNLSSEIGFGTTTIINIPLMA